MTRVKVVIKIPVSDKRISFTKIKGATFIAVSQVRIQTEKNIKLNRQIQTLTHISAGKSVALAFKKQNEKTVPEKKKKNIQVLQNTIKISEGYLKKSLERKKVNTNKQQDGCSGYYTYKAR